MPDALQTELTRKPTPEPVEDTARWPEWAEEARLDDELTAKAYEATPPSCRAALKTGLALAHMHFGQVRAACAKSAGTAIWASGGIGPRFRLPGPFWPLRPNTRPRPG